MRIGFGSTDVYGFLTSVDIGQSVYHQDPHQYMFWQTFGHSAVKSILQKQLAMERFSHAYLFCGPEGVGKKALALEFAKQILLTDRLENHPDFKILDAEGEITMELAKEFIGSLSFKPFLGKKKIAIINNAHNLNTASSNALLKTLEEPSASIIIILIADNKRLLPTILSRCQTFNFNLFSAKQLAEYAKAQSLKATEKVLELAFGSIARLEKLVADKKFLEAESKLAEELEKIKSMPLAERLLAISNYSGLEIEGLRRVFLAWIFWQKQSLKTSQKNFSVLGFLALALEQLETNKNKKFVLQGLFMQM